MLAGFLLSLREGLEAALVIGTISGVLLKLKRNELNSSIWRGVTAGILASLVIAVSLILVGAKLEGTAEEIFEAGGMLLAAGILTWMILWMQKQTRSRQKGIEDKVLQNSDAGGKWQIFSLAFMAVFREGIELTFFLIASTLAGDQNQILVGGMLGLVAAVMIGILWYRSSGKLSLTHFFKVTNILLILFAAGLIAHAIHALNELGWVPALMDPLYNINGFLNENSFIGQLLKTLFGYRATPSLSMAVSYLLYLAAIGSLLLFRSNPRLKKAASGIK